MPDAIVIGERRVMLNDITRLALRDETRDGAWKGFIVGAPVGLLIGGAFSSINSFYNQGLEPRELHGTRDTMVTALATGGVGALIGRAIDASRHHYDRFVILMPRVVPILTPRSAGIAGTLRW
jgi:hypothetical protein